MYCAKIIIPKISDTYKLYVYCAKSADSINTIDKVRALVPSFIIDESIAQTETVNGKECYVLYDNETFTKTGIVYNGPAPNIVPVSEYSTLIDVVKINDYTYVNALKFEELPIKYLGTMLYYSVIGIDEEHSLITHLSKVNGVLINSTYKSTGTRHIYECEEYTGENTDIWKYVSSASWDNNIIIGNIDKPSEIQKYKYPMVSKVPIFEANEISVSTRPINANGFMVLEIPNIWQKNNKKYNFRKLKSYKIKNVDNNQHGDFSEPTYQSLLPMPMEKLLILQKTDAVNPDEIIPLGSINDSDVKNIQVIRRDGIYYNANNHRKLGLNKYNIPLEENIAIFNEASVQDLIKIQVQATSNHVYSFTFYTFDTYGNYSEPIHFVIRT